MVGQYGKEVAIVVSEPGVEGPLADVLHGLEHANGDQFTQGKVKTPPMSGAGVPCCS